MNIPRRTLLMVLRVAVLGLVGLFVWRTVARAWGSLSGAELAIRPEWALAAALVYVVGMAPMAWYWGLVLRAFGQPHKARVVVPAYYYGNLGKYVPGKAMVVVLRTAAVRTAGGDAGPIAASVFVETLTFMAVGGAMAAGLLAFSDGPAWHSTLAALIAVGCALPTLPPVANPIMLRLVGKRLRPDHPPVRITWAAALAGWPAACLAWCVIAVSLQCVIRCCSSSVSPFDLSGYVTCLKAATLPVVAGFLSMIPGGAGVRDALMLEMLAPRFGAETALVAAAATRLIWVITEAGLCGILWTTVRSAPAPTADQQTPKP
ncbi:hypothetical protein Pla175_36270 [Pirellulimonas nuda]|uniref:Uncharacterized protein n=1 Tax=Pirellulimonas nuda TaxID=2528009 RepID=A0A518DFG1_9BACT|nr:lysylphosphatidylglycerol synthase domain-containing protein [Pirellulimonas nuda]QDU90225.1 hypothetical protein Pla175_36270 [Pirellulimonas nuda]